MTRRNNYLYDDGFRDAVEGREPDEPWEKNSLDYQEGFKDGLASRAQKQHNDDYFWEYYWNVGIYDDENY